MKKSSLFIAFVLGCCLFANMSSAQSVYDNQSKQSSANASPKASSNSSSVRPRYRNLKVHPYLIFTKDVENTVKQNVQKDVEWRRYHDAIIAEAGRIKDMPLLKRELRGRRLQSVSQECVRRVTYLAYTSRMTGDETYAKRAIEEMANVARFEDWNPSHFLDVGEMVTAVALGYDWLYDKIPDDTKILLEDAILYKGLIPSFMNEFTFWLTGASNWNQVCHGGLSLGAMALYNSMTDASERIIKRAMDYVPITMKTYSPDGAYPEGFTYWNYGTTYNLIFLDALKTFGIDIQELISIPGFLKTCDFLLNMVLSDGSCMNYGDCGDMKSFEPGVCWFASINNDSSRLWHQKTYFRNNPNTRSRLLVFALLWGSAIRFDDIPEPKEKFWATMKGNVPVATMRTSWNPGEGISAALKGGSPLGGHSHFDVGTFYFVEGNTRWALDLGPESYGKIEASPIDLWDRSQDGDRWSLLRYNNISHNTLTFDGERQIGKGFAAMTKISDNPDFSYSVLDMTTVYANKVTSAKRGMAMVDKKYLLIQDEITVKGATTLRWNLTTKAKPKIVNNKTILLEQDGKELRIEMTTKASVRAKTWSAQPTRDFETPNKDVTFVGFEIKLPANSSNTLVVKLLPDGKYPHEKSYGTLEQW